MADVWTLRSTVSIILLTYVKSLAAHSGAAPSKEEEGLTKKMAGQVVAQCEVVSGAEVGRRLGVSRERVRQWANDPRYGFPISLELGRRSQSLAMAGRRRVG